MTDTYRWYGFDLRNSRSYESGAVGVIIAGQKMLNRTYAEAKRIAAAGPAGLPSGDVTRSDVDILRSAGMRITTDEIGSVWRLDSVPEPSSYMIEVPKSVTPDKTGQYGSTGERYQPFSG